MTDREITNYFDTLDQIDEIEDQEKLFKTLVAITPNLAPEYIEKALKAVKKIKDLSRWNEALIAMAPCFTHEFFEELFKEILTTPVHSRNRGSTLINLTPHIPLGLFKNALQISGEINKPNIRDGVLDEIAPRIENSSLFLEVLKIAIEKSHPKTLILLKSRLQKFPNLLPEIEVLKLAEDFLANKNGSPVLKVIS